LLQDGRHIAPCKNIAGQEQDGQTINCGCRCARHHVGGAGSNGTGASQGAHPAAHFGKCSRRVNHRLFVTGLKIAKVGVLLKSLANPGHVAMPKDAEATGKELSLPPITFDVLCFEKFDDGLRHSKSNRFHWLLRTRKFRP